MSKDGGKQVNSDEETDRETSNVADVEDELPYYSHVDSNPKLKKKGRGSFGSKRLNPVSSSTPRKKLEMDTSGRKKVEGKGGQGGSSKALASSSGSRKKAAPRKRQSTTPKPGGSGCVETSSVNTSQKKGNIRKRSLSKMDSDSTMRFDNYEEDWETCKLDLGLIAKAWLDCNPKRGDGWKNLDLRHWALCVVKLLARKVPAIDAWKNIFEEPLAEMDKLMTSYWDCKANEQPTESSKFREWKKETQPDTRKAPIVLKSFKNHCVSYFTERGTSDERMDEENATVGLANVTAALAWKLHEVMSDRNAMMLPKTIRNLAKPVFKGKFKTVFNKTICLPAIFQEKFPGCIVDAGTDAAAILLDTKVPPQPKQARLSTRGNSLVSFAKQSVTLKLDALKKTMIDTLVEVEGATALANGSRRLIRLRENVRIGLDNVEEQYGFAEGVDYLSRYIGTFLHMSKGIGANPDKKAMFEQFISHVGQLAGIDSLGTENETTTAAVAAAAAAAAQDMSELPEQTDAKPTSSKNAAKANEIQPVVPAVSHQVLDQVKDQEFDQAVNPAVEQVKDQELDQAVNPAVDNIVDQSVNPAVDQVRHHELDQAVNPAVDQAVDQAKDQMEGCSLPASDPNAKPTVVKPGNSGKSSISVPEKNIVGELESPCAPTHDPPKTSNGNHDKNMDVVTLPLAAPLVAPAQNTSSVSKAEVIEEMEVDLEVSTPTETDKGKCADTGEGSDTRQLTEEEKKLAKQQKKKDKAEKTKKKRAKKPNGEMEEQTGEKKQKKRGKKGKKREKKDKNPEEKQKKREKKERKRAAAKTIDKQLTIQEPVPGDDKKLKEDDDGGSDSSFDLAT